VIDYYLAKLEKSVSSAVILTAADDEEVSDFAPLCSGMLSHGRLQKQSTPQKREERQKTDPERRSSHLSSVLVVRPFF